MKCPYCNCEAEIGEIVISATGSIPCAIIEWFSVQKIEKGIFGFAKKKKINISDRNNGHFNNSHYCHNCKKIYCEFTTKE